MTDSPSPISAVVLVGGQSSRFGRDKLLEPVGGGVLVDRPIGVLRAVFGRVGVVGAGDARVGERADYVVDDPYPGKGPIGGVLAALELGDVFVLPGDVPAIDEASVRAIVGAAAAHPGALAVIGRTDRAQPCIGVYRAAARARLAEAIERNELGLGRAVCERVEVEISLDAARNVNRTGDLD
jgi:molybdopterin-guanine dinucleotide biosynthesis protein A